MCESNAFLRKDGRDTMILEDVTFVRPDDGEIRLTSLFGDEKIVKGRIVEIDLMSHKIVLESDEG